jgi:type IV pilus assembly protein PilE
MKMVKAERRGTKARLQGFTFIELLIAMVILGILTSIAFPSFMQSIRKGNRSDAGAALTRAAGSQERFFAMNSTYTDDVADLGFGDDGLTEHEYYNISVEAGLTGIASSYIITATAVAGHMQAQDTGCTVLSLDSLGRQLPDPADSDCW